MNPRMQARVAAFFDLDGTLVPPPSLEWRFFRRLRYRRAIPARNYWLWLREAVRLVPRGIFALHSDNKMYLRGVSVAIEPRAGPANGSGHNWAGRAPLPAAAFFPAAIERVAWHAAQGHAIVLVSGTLEPLAENAAWQLETQLRARGCEPAVRVCATRIEVAGGRFTGHILGQAMAGAEKARAAKQLATAEGWDLARSFAYGDTARDRWLLEIVRYPAAINPTAHLARVASRRGWPMLHWKTAETPPRHGGQADSLMQARFGS